MLNSTQKTSQFPGIWKLCCWIHIRDWICRSCIVIHKSLVLDGSLHYVQCVPYAEILQIFLLFSMISNCRIQSPAVSKQRDVRWCNFRYSIPISNGYLWNACIDMAISTPSCSYCIWNRYWQNHRIILPNFLLFAWFDTLEFNRRLCSNNKMYDDMVFNNRFWYQLTMFEVCIFTGLSRLLDTHIAYEIAISKITTGNLLDAGNDLSCRTVMKSYFIR